MESLRWLFSKIRNVPRYLLLGLGGIVLFLAVLYYPIGMLVMNEIDDDPNFTAAAKFDIPGGSHAVAITEALIEREVHQHHWVPNDPFFLPSSMLIRMPAFQRGIVASLSRFAVELSDQLGRARGSSQADPDLEKAVGLLKYPPTVWVFDLHTSFLPTTPSEDQYLAAEKLFEKFNERLGKGHAVFDRRADNLMEALDRIANDMGSSSAAINDHIRDSSRRFFDGDAANQFYYIKGQMYADYMLLRELKRDFPDIIKEKQLDDAWNNVLESLNEGASLGHFFIFNANPKDQFLPNHLAVQGFYLLRARTQLREVTNILLK
jgi:hypothetical protein